MAIVKVRIAPVEKWCPPMKKLADSLPGKPGIGVQICIDTQSMRMGGEMVLCNGRCWRVVADDLYEKYAAIDIDSKELCDAHCLEWEENWVCEHVLEMD